MPVDVVYTKNVLHVQSGTAIHAFHALQWGKNATMGDAFLRGIVPIALFGMVKDAYHVPKSARHVKMESVCRDPVEPVK